MNKSQGHNFTSALFLYLPRIKFVGEAKEVYGQLGTLCHWDGQWLACTENTKSLKSHAPQGYRVVQCAQSVKVHG